MGFFDLNFAQLAERISPPFKRGEKILLWYKDILSPLQTTRDDFFNNFAPDIEDRTRYNSQVLVLEKILNDTFGIQEAPFIFIQNQENTVDELIFRKEVEAFPSIFFRNESEIPDSPIYFRNESEVITDFDFIVFVPIALFPTIEEQVRATTEDLRIAGVNFDVQSYA